MSGRVRASPSRASSTTRGALRSVIGTLLQLEQFVDVAHEFVLLVRLAEVELDADIHRALAVLLAGTRGDHHDRHRSEEHTSELQSLMRISYAVFCLKQKTQYNPENQDT